MVNINEIKEKHKLLLNRAETIMESIDDPEHNIMHMNEVIEFTVDLLNNLDDTIDSEVCIIAAYWHDTGRSIQTHGHEQVSAKMLKEEMLKLKYENDFIQKCYDAIEFHKWNMTPITIEGWIVKDADKIAWIGTRRWEECMNNQKTLNDITDLLPNLRNEILHFEYSKKIYDNQIIKLLNLIYDRFNFLNK